MRSVWLHEIENDSTNHNCLPVCAGVSASVSCISASPPPSLLYSSKTQERRACPISIPMSCHHLRQQHQRLLVQPKQYQSKSINIRQSQAIPGQVKQERQVHSSSVRASQPIPGQVNQYQAIPDKARSGKKVWLALATCITLASATFPRGSIPSKGDSSLSYDHGL